MSEEIKRLKNMIAQEVEEKGRALIFLNDHENSWEIDALNQLLAPQAKAIEVTKTNFLDIKLIVELRNPEDSFVLVSKTPYPDEDLQPIMSIYLNSKTFKHDDLTVLAERLNADEWKLRELHNAFPNFFKDAKRVTRLVNLLKKNVDLNLNEMALVAALPNMKPTLMENLQLVISEGADLKKNKFLKSMESFGLTEAFVKAVEHELGIEITGNVVESATQAIILSVYLRDGGEMPEVMRPYQSSQPNKLAMIFEQHVDDLWLNKADQFMDSIQEKIKDLSLRQLSQFKFFTAIDEKILNTILEQLAEGFVDTDRVMAILNHRLQLDWVLSQPKLQQKYEFLKVFIKTRSLLAAYQEKLTISYIDINSLYEFYAEEGYKLDLNFRKLSVLNDAIAVDEYQIQFQKLQVEYEREWLQVIATQSSDAIKKLTQREKMMAQSRFYRHYIESQPKNIRQFVIVSDAFRYEIAQELAKRLKMIPNSKVLTDAMLASVPTYTAIGMASLLPQIGPMTLQANKTICLDGMSTNGIANREKILQKANPDAVALKLSEFMDLTTDEQRYEYIKGKKVVYLYHDWIDAIGDTGKTEARTYREVQTAISEIEITIKKLMSSSKIDAKRILITADHGFNFVSESTKSYMKTIGIKESYVEGNTRFKIYQADEINEESIEYGSFMVPEKARNFPGYTTVIAEGLNRFRSGSGTRFFHGGVTPQERIVPVITLEVSTDAKPVEISLLDVQRKITDFNLKIPVHQNLLMSESMLPRTIRFTLLQDDHKISNQVIEEFNATKKQDQGKIITINIFEDEYPIQSTATLLLEVPNAKGKWERYNSYEYTMMIIS